MPSSGKTVADKKAQKRKKKRRAAAEIPRSTKSTHNTATAKSQSDMHWERSLEDDREVDAGINSGLPQIDSTEEEEKRYDCRTTVKKRESPDKI